MSGESTVMGKLAAAAKRWVELLAAAEVARKAFWEASANTQTTVYLDCMEDTGYSGGERMFELVSEPTGSDPDYPVYGDRKWVYSSAMGTELAGEDCTRDPLWIAQTEARKASIKANRAAGHARGCLLRMTRAAIKRGEL